MSTTPAVATAPAPGTFPSSPGGSSGTVPGFAQPQVRYRTVSIDGIP